MGRKSKNQVNFLFFYRVEKWSSEKKTNNCYISFRKHFKCIRESTNSNIVWSHIYYLSQIYLTLLTDTFSQWKWSKVGKMSVKIVEKLLRLGLGYKICVRGRWECGRRSFMIEINSFLNRFFSWFQNTRFDQRTKLYLANNFRWLE